MKVSCMAELEILEEEKLFGRKDDQRSTSDI